MKRTWLFWMLPVLLLASCGKEPVACFTYSVVSGNVGKFTPDCSANVTSYEWDFGDGEQSTEEYPTHDYLQPGEFVVTLKATSEKGESNSSSQTITIARYCVTCTCNGIDVTDYCGTKGYVLTACSTCEDHQHCNCEKHF